MYFLPNSLAFDSLKLHHSRSSSREEKPRIQGKRNPSKTVGAERGHQRADRLKPQWQITSQSDHMDHSLSKSMKLSHAMWGHPRWTGHDGEVWQNVVHWRREWQTTSVFLPWEPHEQYKRQKDRTLKDELPRSVGAQYALEISGEITLERMKGWSQSKNNTQLWMWLVMEAGFDAVKSSTA